MTGDEALERTYLDIVRKAAFHARGRRIVLKSPSNLARIPHVLRIFPDARFVNIVRNPFTVYLSLTNMFRKLIPIHQLQDVEWDELERVIIDVYKADMKRYFATAPSYRATALSRCASKTWSQRRWRSFGGFTTVWISAAGTRRRNR